MLAWLDRAGYGAIPRPVRLEDPDELVLDDARARALGIIADASALPVLRGLRHRLREWVDRRYREVHFRRMMFGDRSGPSPRERIAALEILDDFALAWLTWGTDREMFWRLVGRWEVGVGHRFDPW
jgi:hypothetical protein